VVLVHRDFESVDGGPSTRIVVSDPRAALSQLLAHTDPTNTVQWGLSPTAQIGCGTKWSGRIAVGSHSAIGRGCTVGFDCTIGQHAVIGDEVDIGDGVHIGDHVVIERGSRIGDRAIIQPGARIGTTGFGYAGQGGEGGPRHVPHVGGCTIGRDVDIGANSTIARGTLDDTSIGDRTKIDNLVHIAHNVRIGRGCLIMAQVGIAGSTTVEDDAILAGQAGLADHLQVGRAARVAAQSGVIGNIPAGATVSGYPARDHREVLRQTAALRRLAPLIAQLEALVAADGSSATVR